METNDGQYGGICSMLLFEPHLPIHQHGKKEVTEGSELPILFSNLRYLIQESLEFICNLFSKLDVIRKNNLQKFNIVITQMTNSSTGYIFLSMFNIWFDCKLNTQCRNIFFASNAKNSLIKKRFFSSPKVHVEITIHPNN